MAETISNKNIWNEACRSGLVLGVIPIIASLLSQFASGLHSSSTLIAMSISVLSFAIWAAKLIFCIWAMAFFMRKLVAKYDGVTGRDTFRFGVATAILSALIVAAFSLATTLMNPHQMAEAYDTAIQAYSGTLDANGMSLLERIKDNMPEILFCMTLIYCFLYGLVVSAILSNSIPSKNPFEDKS